MAKKAELQCYMNLTEHSLAIEDLEHFARLVRNDYSNKPWVGLTKEEAADCWSNEAVRTWHAIEDKLKEKNT
jgi:hypothetical protein